MSFIINILKWVMSGDQTFDCSDDIETGFSASAMLNISSDGIVAQMSCCKSSEKHITDNETLDEQPRKMMRTGSTADLHDKSTVVMATAVPISASVPTAPIRLKAKPRPMNSGASTLYHSLSQPKPTVPSQIICCCHGRPITGDVFCVNSAHYSAVQQGRDVHTLYFCKRDNMLLYAEKKQVFE